MRVTLYLPESLVERAKIAGIHAKRSVSEMVAEGLKPLVEEIERKQKERPPTHRDGETRA